MNAIRILALALIIGGALGLAYGGFSYTKENHEAKIGRSTSTWRRKNTSTSRCGPASAPS